jgi:hypothetical protein
MTYLVTSPQAGFQPIADTSTTKNHALGTICTAVDPTYGVGEFIYLQGIGSTVAGTIVTFDAATFLTALAPATANVSAPVAFAMSANVASSYGWYQISGNAVAAKNATVSLNARQAVGVQTAGVLNSSITGLNVDGAVVQATVTSATTTVVVTINRPHMQGRGAG